MFSLTWQTLPTIFNAPKPLFYGRRQILSAYLKKRYQPSKSLTPTAAEVTSCMVTRSSKQNCWPLAAVGQRPCSTTGTMENPRMGRDEKCQALLSKGKGYQARMDRVLTEPGEPEAKTRQTGSLWDQPLKVTRAPIQNTEWFRCLLPPRLTIGTNLHVCMHTLKCASQGTGLAAVPGESAPGFCSLDRRVCGALRDWGSSHQSTHTGTSAPHPQVLQTGSEKPPGFYPLDLESTWHPRGWVNDDHKGLASPAS